MRILAVLTLWLCLQLPGWAQAPSPRWNGLTSEQQKFLLEGLGVDPATRAQFFDPVPIEVKQALLDSFWSALPPDKQEQVALYAHLVRPIDIQSKVPAPTWANLSERQRGAALDAFKLDPTQRLVFLGMPPDMQQMAVGMMWQYLDPAVRQQVLASP